MYDLYPLINNIIFQKVQNGVVLETYQSTASSASIIGRTLAAGRMITAPLPFPVGTVATDYAIHGGSQWRGETSV